ncbi:MAG: TolC family protein [Bacteroidetes bacterium]|nr:MAG: TolC family protein [Bacteroidota bacterium]
MKTLKKISIMNLPGKRIPELIAILMMGYLLLFPAGGTSLQAQDALTLDFCYRMAEQNFPLAGQLDLLSGSSKLKVQNLNKNWLPSININGQVSYQSDVTKVVIQLPAGLPPLDMPELSKDWYKATLDVGQTIWDGNVTSYQKKLEEVNLQVDQTNVKAELYKLKEQVNQFYFSIILLNQNEELLLSSKQQLEEKLQELNAGIAFGAVLQSVADALEAELIRIDQRITESRADRSGLIRMLSELISVELPESVILVMPDPLLADYTFQNNRLENEVFDLQRGRLELLQSMVTTKWNPKFFAFGQAGIGRPGLNMLSDNFDPFYIVGIKLNWNPWNWNANKNEKKILGIQSDILQTQQASFDKNLKIQSHRELTEILKMLEVLKQDQEIIALREKISQSASAQLDNGVITSSDYVTRLTEERQARLNFEIHKVQLVKAKLSYLYDQGRL